MTLARTPCRRLTACLRVLLLVLLALTTISVTCVALTRSGASARPMMGGASTITTSYASPAAATRSLIRVPERSSAGFGGSGPEDIAIDILDRCHLKRLGCLVAADQVVGEALFVPQSQLRVE